MRLARWLLVAHAGVVSFGLAGMLIVLPGMGEWLVHPAADAVLLFGMRHGGEAQIWLGAAAAFVFAVVVLGWRRAGLFLAVAVIVSLGMELLGTITGWPFGAYTYGFGLGPKVLGQVPLSIPFSWFYMGLASYLLATIVVGSRFGRFSALAGVVLGVWFLVTWDLLLDPAMSHPDAPVRFWSWGEPGSYYGMPLRNLAGWALTGGLFIGISRALWGRGIDAASIPPVFPTALYLVNQAFAFFLCIGSGLWWAAVVGVALTAAPLVLLRLPERFPAPAPVAG